MYFIIKDNTLIFFNFPSLAGFIRKSIYLTLVTLGTFTDLFDEKCSALYYVLLNVFQLKFIAAICFQMYDA